MTQVLAPVVLFLCAAALLEVACAAPQAEVRAVQRECPAEVDETQLQLDYEHFDAAGWRDLLTRGCTDEAVALLRAYRSTRSGSLTEAQRLELAFHIGQALAFSGRDADSIQYFEQARGGPEEWAAYVDATLAFLNKDAVALVAAQTRYAHAPHADQMRLQVIEGFIGCADQSYAQAAMCGMASHDPSR